MKKAFAHHEQNAFSGDFDDQVLTLIPADVFSFRPAIAFFDLKDDLLAFIQTLVAIHGDGRKMYKNVPAAFFIDKPVTLFVVEPLHRTVRQSSALLFNTFALKGGTCCRMSIDPSP
jgi:hypothetical protein